MLSIVRGGVTVAVNIADRNSFYGLLFILRKLKSCAKTSVTKQLFLLPICWLIDLLTQLLLVSWHLGHTLGSWEVTRYKHPCNNPCPRSANRPRQANFHQSANTPDFVLQAKQNPVNGRISTNGMLICQGLDIACMAIAMEGGNPDTYIRCNVLWACIRWRLWLVVPMGLDNWLA